MQMNVFEQWRRITYLGKRMSGRDSAIEGACATRCLNPLLGKIELSIMSCRKHVFSSDYLPLTIEMSQEMNLKTLSMILQRS